MLPFLNDSVALTAGWKSSVPRKLDAERRGLKHVLKRLVPLEWPSVRQLVEPSPAQDHRHALVSPRFFGFCLLRA